MSNPSGTDHDDADRAPRSAAPTIGHRGHRPVTEVSEYRRADRGLRIRPPANGVTPHRVSMRDRRRSSTGYPMTETEFIATPTEAFGRSSRRHAPHRRPSPPRVAPRRRGWLIPVIAGDRRAGRGGDPRPRAAQRAPTRPRRRRRTWCVRPSRPSTPPCATATWRRCATSPAARPGTTTSTTTTRAWADTYARVSAAKQYPVVASIDEVVVNGDHAEANVTSYMAFDPATTSTRSFDLQFRDDQWKICQSS